MRCLVPCLHGSISVKVQKGCPGSGLENHLLFCVEAGWTVHSFVATRDGLSCVNTRAGRQDKRSKDQTRDEKRQEDKTSDEKRRDEKRRKEKRRKEKKRLEVQCTGSKRSPIPESKYVKRALLAGVVRLKVPVP